jgi:hypothetical protein
VFFGDDVRMTPTEIRGAKRICATCPVAMNCLAKALVTREPSGVWGGMTFKERQRLMAAAHGNLTQALLIAGGSHAR